MSIYPVILSGGSGTRLWPLSRKHYPKQLLSLTSDKSLLQETLNRVTGKNFEAPLVICNDQHRFSVAEQVRQINLYVRDIILEPIGRNTAPAAAIAALTLRAIDKDATILLLPSDHLIENRKAFLAAIKTAANDACMHSVATRPIAMDRSDIPDEIIAKEKEVFMDEVNKKPENIREKIMEGKLKKFRDSQSLVKQAFVKDSSKTVEAFLTENNAKVEKFVRLAI